jgi:hypothetical protein
MSESLTGAQFKDQLRGGTPQLGLFLNSHSATGAEQNDLHHILTQAGAYVKDVEGLRHDNVSAWLRRPSALIYSVF